MFLLRILCLFALRNCSVVLGLVNVQSDGSKIHLNTNRQLFLASKEEKAAEYNRSAKLVGNREERILNGNAGEESQKPAFNRPQQPSIIFPPDIPISSKTTPRASRKTTTASKVQISTTTLSTTVTTRRTTTSRSPLAPSTKSPVTLAQPPVENQTSVATARNKSIGISVGVVAFVIFLILILLAIRYYRLKRKSTSPQVTPLTIAKLQTLVFTENEGDRKKIRCATNEKAADSIRPVYAVVEYLPPTRCSQIEELPALPLAHQLGDYEVIAE